MGLPHPHAALLSLRYDRAADAPPLTHPGFYYGFIGVALSWQVAFLIIGNNPVRYRPMMIPAMPEKFIYGLSLIVLYWQGRIGPKEMAGLLDLVFGVLFVIAFLRTPPQARQGER
jgi:hypothetical protein